MSALLLIAGCVLVAVFLVALLAGWFSRLERGFLATVILAITGFAALGAVLSGILSYRAGKQVLLQQIVAGLSSTGQVVEANLRQTIDHEVEVLHEEAGILAADLKHGKEQQLPIDLRRMDELNDEIFQISVFDTHTAMVATSFVTSVSDRMNLVAVATALEGNDYVSDAEISPVSNTWVLIVATPIRDARKTVIGAVTVRYDLQRELSSLFRATRFAGNGYAAIAANSGRFISHPNSKMINVDISSYPAFQMGREGAGWVVHRNLAGRQRLFVYRPVKPPANANLPPWVLLVEMDEAQAVAPIDTLRNEVLLALGIVIIPGLLIGWRVGVSISGPLKKLGRFVRKVEGGDFTGSVPEGRDEIGLLGSALNHMTHGLQERDRVKEIFGRYVATQVSDRILKGDVDLGGVSRRVTILFSDIRSFTAMSETMTPAQVVAFLNDYFSEMVEAVFEQGGILDKFMGDGLMAVFGSIGDMPDHPRRAVLAALRMKALLSKINGDRAMLGKPPIAIGIGVHTDDVIVGNIGSRRRLEYTVIGDGVNTCSRVQALNKEFGTTILITQTTYDTVKDEFECRAMPEKELRGKTHALKFYEVLSVKAAATSAP